jgi:anti-sigma regulatory factor (Ser/Thr protein kinase)
MTDEPSSQFPITIGMRLPNLMFLTRPLREFLALSLVAKEFDEEWIDEFGLAVTELVNNSFEHASNSVSHEVDLEFRVFEDRVSFRIRDEGQGQIDQDDFDFEGKGPPDHLEDRGRGLFLISCFTDDIQVKHASGGGTEVTITKMREGGE